MGKIVRDLTLQETNEILRNIRDNLAPEGEKSGTIYSFMISSSESDPGAAVTYIEDTVGFEPAHMDYTSGVFSYGSWQDAFFMPKPCMLKNDGTVDYYLDPDDYSKKEDGTASDAANTLYQGNAMMEWGQNGKKIWYLISPQGDGKSAVIKVADYQVDSRYHAWSFINNDGDLVDHFYTPCYFGTIVDGTLRSLSGQSGSARCKNLTINNARTAAKSNNPSQKDLWDIEVYADIVLINILLILIGKSLDTQSVFGIGLTISGTDSVNDAFVSGQHDAHGLFYGTTHGEADTLANTVKVFGMENYWGFMWRQIAGLVGVNGYAKYKLTKGTQDGTTISDYAFNTSSDTYTGYLSHIPPIPSVNGTYIRNMAFDSNQFIPTVANASDHTYYCDAMWHDKSIISYAVRGGPSDSLMLNGAFYIGFFSAMGSTAWSIGAALSCKPSKVVQSE